MDFLRNARGMAWQMGRARRELDATQCGRCVNNPARRPLPAIPFQCRISIPLKFTVPVAEQFRAAAIARFSKMVGNQTSSFALTGHDKPVDANGDHQHAFFLPLGTNSHHPDSLNELHVWCPYGFTQAEVEALMRVRRLDWGGGRYPVRPVLMALANDAPEGCPIATGQRSARRWRARTPFVPPRYFYRRNLHGAQFKGKDAPEQQLAQCLRQSGIDTPGEIRRLTLNGDAQKSLPPLAAWEIVRAPENQHGSSADSVVTPVHLPADSTTKSERVRRVGLFFEVIFDAPVTFRVPALGNSCHFGLGLFAPVCE